MGQCTSAKSMRNLHTKQDSSMASIEIGNELKSGSIIEKNLNKASERRIMNTLKSHHLFFNITQEDFKLISPNLKFLVFPKNSEIFKQGDQGNFFYIVDSGCLSVVLNGVKKNILQAGDTSGEMSLLTNSLRRASLYTIEESQVWVIHKEDFLLLVRKINEKSYSEHYQFVSNLSFFSSLSQEILDLLTKAAVQENYKDSHRIICEGDNGVLLYIIKEGEAVAKIQGIEHFRLSKGQMFGESVLLGQNTIRKFSIYSVGEISVLSLSRNDMVKIIGEDFKNILYMSQTKNSLNSDKYAKFLTEDSINSIVDSATWKFFSPGDLIPSPTSIDSVYILCLGTLATDTKVYKSNDIIGFSMQNDRDLADEELRPESETILGVISVNKIEIATKMPWQALHKLLKIVGFLKRLEQFANLPYSKLRNIAVAASYEYFEKNEIIYKCNDEAKKLYFIKKGGVRIHNNGKILRILKKNNIFGDNCLQETTRNTFAEAFRKTKCLAINKKDLKYILDEKDGKLFYKSKSYASKFQLYELLFNKIIGKNNTKTLISSTSAETQIKYYVEVIKKSDIDTLENYKKLVDEKNIGISIQHPLILRLVKTFSDDNFLYIAYESFKVFEFSSVLNGPTSEVHAKFLTAALLSILEYFFENNILFRDFSLSEIKINKLGYPFISSLSSAKIVKDRAYTRVGDILYTAPEVLIGDSYTKAINYWSLGIMVYQFLYGTFPFDVSSKDPIEIFQKILHGKIIFPNNTKYIRANEVIQGLLKINYNDRLTLEKIKFSRWLDSIDWKRINNLTYKAPVLPDRAIDKDEALSRSLSLSRYLNEIYFKKSKNKRNTLKVNWEKNF